MKDSERDSLYASYTCYKIMHDKHDEKILNNNSKFENRGSQSQLC